MDRQLKKIQGYMQAYYQGVKRSREMALLLLEDGAEKGEDYNGRGGRTEKTAKASGETSRRTS